MLELIVSFAGFLAPKRKNKEQYAVDEKNKMKRKNEICISTFNIATVVDTDTSVIVTHMQLLRVLCIV